MLVTFSTKFNALDTREAAILESLSGAGRTAFEQLFNAYEAEFEPQTNPERDNVYCLATLRWGIDRIRHVEETTRDLFRHHGYLTTKMKGALDELAAYQRELNIRYEYFFSYHHRVLLKNRKAA